MMGAARGKDTGPERAVRKALHLQRYRYRLHRRDLPGAPDIVLPREPSSLCSDNPKEQRSPLS
jgi:DNA mismatch endonuclease, patch repair protein